MESRIARRPSNANEVNALTGTSAAAAAAFIAIALAMLPGGPEPEIAAVGAPPFIKPEGAAMFPNVVQMDSNTFVH